MKQSGGNERGVEGGEGIAVIVEGLVSERGDWKTVLRVSGHHEGEEELEEEIAAVDFPGVCIGASILWNALVGLESRKAKFTYLGNMPPHLGKERLDVLGGCRMHKLAIVEPEANPKIVHENGEASHDGDDAPRTTELVAVEN